MPVAKAKLQPVVCGAQGLSGDFAGRVETPASMLNIDTI